MTMKTSGPRVFTPKNMAERDLSFADATGEKTLSAAQVASYNARGYLHPLTAFDGDAVLRVRAYVDHLFELLKARGVTDNYALLGYHTRCPGLYDIVMNSRILDVVEDIVGPDIICWTSQVFSKEAHDPKAILFHQDGSYWPLTPARTVSVWLAIDDADRENSCLQVIPGTHRMGLLPWGKASGNAVLDQEMHDPTSYGEPQYIELKAGQFSLHADMMAHGSDPNRSDRRRCGFAIRYCSPSVKPLKKDWSRNAILCRGSDTTGYWTYSERPEEDDVGDWPSYWMRKLRGGVDIGGGNIGA